MWISPYSRTGQSRTAGLDRAAAQVEAAVRTMFTRTPGMERDRRGGGVTA